MVFEYNLRTERTNFYNITSKVREAVTKSGIVNGICIVYCPHTTAGITINENADPDVIRDMLSALKQMVPNLSYRHREGNSPAHILSTLIGCSITVPIEARRLCLGTWQGIYLCEFDGPRQRKVWIQLVGK